MKCIKKQNRSGTKLINWDSSRPIFLLSILFKRLEDTVLHKHYEINQEKDRQSHKFGSNKVCVGSLTKFSNFLKHANLNHFQKKFKI